MSRKRKNKKSRPGGEGQGTTTGVETSGNLSASETQPPSSAAADGTAGSDGRDEKNNLAGPAPVGIGLEANPEPARRNDTEQPDLEPRIAEESDREPMYEAKPPSDGIIGRIVRWWRGPSPVTVRVPSNPPGSIAAERVPTAPPSGGAQAAERIASGKISEVSAVSAGGPSSAISQVHAVLMLERILPELEETKRLLRTERESAQAKTRDLENERDRFRAEAERARNERADLEGHTNMLRKSVNALERQLHEERATAATKAEEYEARLRSFEESVKHSRTPVAELRTELVENKLQAEQLESLLDRAKEELERAQRELQEERELSQGRIERLESELSRKSGAGDQAISERKRIEERAALVQKALEVMEQQLREERESSSNQVRQLETELTQSRAKSAQLETRVNSLIGELERNKSRSRKKGASRETESEESATLTTRSAGRIQALESELATDTSTTSAERQTATTRISRLESRWGDLKSRLLPKDKEITELRQQAEDSQAQIEELEAALAEARQHSGSPAAAAQGEGEETGGGLLALSRDAAQTLYNQSMGKLTVLMASADIVLMNQKLDPKVKGSVEDIKTEGQALLELIKSFTLPPESKKSE